jgi:predicted flap endonuclease-1-like 5' DNA nuclease
MASLIHIAEVAAVLAVAYVLGWAIGYGAHRLFALMPARAAAVPAEPIAAVLAAPDPDALVKAPVIDPVPNSPPRAAVAAAEPAAPPSAPVPEAIATAQSAVEAEPEAVAPGLARIAIPVTPPPPPLIIEPLPPRRKPRVDPDPPPPAPEPEVILTAAPAIAPGVAWSGEVRGRAALPVTPAAVEPEIPVAETVGEASEAPPAEIPMSIDLGPVGPDSTYGEPVVPEPTSAPSPDPEPVAIVETAPEPAVPPVRPPAEDDAMRAIEGGWSRVRARALPGAPELSDVGAAVAAAQSAVEQVLAQAGIEAEPAGKAARPKGLPGARDGRKDDLKLISGLGALDESTLNNLGVFHFDQIAGWDAGQVVWMESHVFARGRIGHENWQQQARDLAAAVAT